MQEKKNDSEPPASRWEGVGIDLLGVLGLGSLTYGCWLIYPPLAFLVFGALILIGTVRVAMTRGR
jgi:hypothetical protein